MSNLKDLLKAAVENIGDLQKCMDIANAGEEVNIDSEDVGTLMEIYKKNDDKVKLMNLIADLARVESNRKEFTREELLKDITQNISSDDPQTTLQAIRCLCNICAENDSAKTFFSSNNGVTSLLSKAEDIIERDDEAWNNLICPACSCIQNIVVDSETLSREFLDKNALNILWRYLAKFHATDPKIAGVVLSGLGSFCENEFGLQQLYESGVLKLVIKLIHAASDEIVKLIFENLLKELAGGESGRSLLIKSDCMQEMTKIIESEPNFKEVEVNETVKEIADFVILLTSGEESFTTLRASDKDFLQRFSSWIKSPNKHIQVSAGLAIGNYIRDEETCKDVTKTCIHESLINVMKEHVKDESFNDRAQAYGSCLRNLCIPVENKRILYDAGLHSVAISYVINTESLPVQFKVLAILRLIVQDNVELATSLCTNKDLITKLIELNKTSVVSSVPAETQRLLASIIKYSSSEDPIRSVLSLNGLGPVLELLKSDHTIMQSEGLIAIIMIAANIRDCAQLFKENECIEKVFELLGKPEVQAQTCFNGLTCVQAVLGIDGGKDLLVSHDVQGVLEKLKKHPEEIIVSKAKETEELLASV